MRVFNELYHTHEKGDCPHFLRQPAKKGDCPPFLSARLQRSLTTVALVSRKLTAFSRRNPRCRRPRPPSFSSRARTAAALRPLRSAYRCTSASTSSSVTLIPSRRATSSRTSALLTASLAASF